ncbi:MAG: hypothetical protein AMS18_16465 [Gemmatimonas sp. SG8_17]|nr:MAG: hypothetical protein AMS18_16465 [Gemmatimonas sp. SG8_17]
MQSATSAWAVVLTPQGMLIGCAPDRSPENLVQAVREHEAVWFDPVYELFSNVSVHPQSGIQKIVIALPFLYTNLGAPVLVQPIGVQLFRDMKEGDRQRYKNLVRAAERQMEELRARDSGITLAKGNIPKQ